MKSLLVVLAVALCLAACSAPPPVPPRVAAVAPPPAPAVALAPVSLLRQSLGPGASPSPGAALYLYLLVGSHEADRAKVLAAFNAYVCEIPPNVAAERAAAQAQGRKLGVYLVPVATAAAAAAPLGKGDAEKLLDEYDYARAADMLLQLVQSGLMRRQDLTPTAIYLAGFDAPLPQRPAAHAIYEISRLPNAADVGTWLVAEQQSIELGGVASTTGVRRVPPTFVEILDGLGQTVATFARITTPAEAATIPCR